VHEAKALNRCILRTGCVSEFDESTWGKCMLIEANIDALVGPTHHFGGLGVGNVASIAHQNQTSHPKEAALEGLRKAALVASLGVPQFVWLPPARPRTDMLPRLGFQGPLAEQLRTAYETDPKILSAIYSSSFMWAANAATITPAIDAWDARTHITPANLISSWHRGSEAQERLDDLQQTVGALSDTALHQPLPSIVPLRDEGAANHMRLCDATGEIGFNIFVYGEDQGSSWRFMPRQTLAACQAIARQHRLDPARTSFVQQHPTAITAGVFHNDVIATSHRGLLIHHELAFANAARELELLEEKFLLATGQRLIRYEVRQQDMPLEDAVHSYFFNSQILTVENSQQPSMALLCPTQCKRIESSQRLIQQLLRSNEIPIEDVHFVSLAESMANGGGPACLRLRWPLDDACLRGLVSPHRLTSKLEERLVKTIERVYPDRIELADMANVEFAEQAMRAVTELAGCLL
jgi:succinylarginine dihydrolase